MYLEHFGLRDYPFSLTPDTSFYFGYSSHRAALNVLLVALRTGEGFIKVVGEVGLGKSLLCRKLLNDLGAEFVTAYIPNPHLSPASMRFALARELGTAVTGSETQEELMRGITQRLLDLAAEGRRVVVCLDEAQELPVATFEAVRLLTNLETEKRKLLQVVLFGQPELNRRLRDPAMRQLLQRITFSFELQPLTRQAVCDYVRHRLRVAGSPGGALFTPRALRMLHRASSGTPRLVNVLGHKALLAAFGDGAGEVKHHHVRRAREDTDGTRRSGLRAWWYAGAYALSAAGCGALLWFAVRAFDLVLT